MVHKRNGRRVGFQGRNGSRLFNEAKLQTKDDDEVDEKEKKGNERKLREGVSNRGGEMELENGVLVVDGGELVGVRWLLVLCRDGLTFTLFNVMDSSRVGRYSVGQTVG